MWDMGHSEESLCDVHNLLLAGRLERNTRSAGQPDGNSLTLEILFVKNIFFQLSAPHFPSWTPCVWLSEAQADFSCPCAFAHMHHLFWDVSQAHGTFPLPPFEICLIEHSSFNWALNMSWTLGWALRIQIHTILESSVRECPYRTLLWLLTIEADTGVLWVYTKYLAQPGNIRQIPSEWFSEL